VDRFNNLMVSAYVTVGGAYFLLLHAGKNEDSIRAFFMEVYEVYVKQLLNPFSRYDSIIISPQFDNHVKLSARKYLSL